MTLETVFDTLKREHQSQQPHHPQPLPATVGLTPAFRNAAQASPAYLEDLHIRLMSSGFAKVCLGDVLNIRVRIAEDKVSLVPLTLPCSCSSKLDSAGWLMDAE